MESHSYQRCKVMPWWLRYSTAAALYPKQSLFGFSVCKIVFLIYFLVEWTGGWATGSRTDNFPILEKKKKRKKFKAQGSHQFLMEYSRSIITSSSPSSWQRNSKNQNTNILLKLKTVPPNMPNLSDHLHALYLTSSIPSTFCCYIFSYTCLTNSLC